MLSGLANALLTMLSASEGVHLLDSKSKLLHIAASFLILILLPLVTTKRNK